MGTLSSAEAGEPDGDGDTRGRSNGQQHNHGDGERWGIDSERHILVDGAGGKYAADDGNVVNQTISEDGTTGPLNVSVGDAESSAGALVLTGTSSNTGLVPNGNIAFGGSGASRTVTVTPAANQFGTATITLTVSDGQLTAVDTFDVVVNAVNDAPTISNIADQSGSVGAPIGPLAVTVGDAETAAGSRV